MYLFQRVLSKIRRWVSRKQDANFTVDVQTLRSLEMIAEHEKSTPEEIANRILVNVLRNHQAQGENWQRWQTLTPREQQIAALVCLNYTSRQIASHLHISPETVKTHVEHVLMKFGVPDRNQLRLMLSDWDFTGWDYPESPVLSKKL